MKNERKQAVNAGRKRDNAGRFTTAGKEHAFRRVHLRITQEEYSLLEMLCDELKLSQHAVVVAGLKAYYKAMAEGTGVSPESEAMD